MTKSDALESPRLTLNRIEVNTTLLRKFPVDLAYRYHSLPIAETDELLTVVMADPEDAVGRQAIQEACQKRAYIVRGDLKTIDALIAKHIPRTKGGRILVCCTSDEVKTLDEFAHTFGAAFDTARVDYCIIEKSRHRFDDLFPCINRHDLVLLSIPETTLVRRIISGSLEQRILKKLSTSCLFPRSPRLPLKSILFLLHGDEGDIDAADVVARIATSNAANVIALILIPQVPLMYHGLDRMNPSLTDILQMNCELGCLLRRVAKRFCSEGIRSEIHLKQGPAGMAIQQEISESDFDLIVTSRRLHDWLYRKVEDDIFVRLLQWIDRPVLITTQTRGTPDVRE